MYSTLSVRRPVHAVFSRMRVFAVILALGVAIGGCSEAGGPGTMDPAPASDRTAVANPSDDPEGDPHGTDPSDPRDDVTVGDRFIDVAESSGLDFIHDYGGFGERYMVETLSGGGGWLDADGDGWMDAYLVQGGPLPGHPDSTGSPPAGNQLFRNRGDGTFEDITSAAGVGDTRYGMGACFGDVNNDGAVDIHVTNFGPDVLLKNRGDGTFEDVSAAAGIDNARWSAGCAFADFDQDGWLDLFVVNYVDFSVDNHVRCTIGPLPGYCHPDHYSGVPDVLYRNRGDGTFEDVSAAAGIQINDPNESKGLGVTWLDFDDDGDQDAYVANDSTRNFLWRNRGDGTFTDESLVTGTAFNRSGRTEAGMGIVADDLHGDGRLDLFVTHLDGETNTLYRNVGPERFEDVTARSGLAAPSLQRVGFGASSLDVEHDGDLDLFVANGHIIDNVEQVRTNTQFRQPDQLFLNRGSGTFLDASAASGKYFAERAVSRATATADYDGDGDLDILVVRNDGPAALLQNVASKDGGSVILDLRSRHGGRPAVGARVTVHGDGRSWIREVRAGGSYLAQSSPKVHLGLDRKALEGVTVRWPEGSVDELSPAALGPADATGAVIIREGDGG